VDSTADSLPVLRPGEIAAREFTCAEVWGGNRFVSRPVLLPGIDGYLWSHPCLGGRGGDVHFLSICGSGLLSRFCLADVAGHGESVAAVSSELHRLLRKYMNFPDQRRVLRALNRKLEAGGVARTMTTAVAVTYYPPRGYLSVSYAGHPPGWLYDAAACEWQRLLMSPAGRLGSVDLPLAASSETRFNKLRRRVRVGDRLLLVTDGVLEAPGPDREFFGEARVGAVLREHHRESVEAIVRALVAAVIAHTGRPDLPHDDATALLVEFVPGPRGLGILHALRNRLRLRRRPASPD